MEDSITPILFDEGIYIIKENVHTQSEIKSEPKKVVIPIKEVSSDKAILPEFNGNSNSKVICLIDDDSSQSLILLKNIMKAVKLEEKDFAWTKNKMSSDQVAENFKMVFNFNSMPDLSKENSILNEIFHIAQRRQLNTFGLIDLEKDIEKKKALWATLTKMVK